MKSASALGMGTEIQYLLRDWRDSPPEGNAQNLISLNTILLFLVLNP